MSISLGHNYIFLVCFLILQTLQTSNKQCVHTALDFVLFSPLKQLMKDLQLKVSLRLVFPHSDQIHLVSSFYVVPAVPRLYFISLK